MQFKSDTRLLLISGFLFCSCHHAQPVKTAADTVNLKAPGISYHTWKGVTGKRTSVTLADSSTVILNSASVLEVPDNYPQGNRRVILNGEAFFDVRPRTDSFIVVSDKLTATVLGTSPDSATVFKMRSFGSQHGATAYLLSGKIRIGKSYHSPTDNQPEILERGQMILANNDIDLMEKETYHPSEQEAWLSDSLHISHTNVMAFSRMLEDWFGVDVEIKGDTGEMPVIENEIFYKASLEDVLRRIGAQQHFKYRISDNKVTITYGR
ncbi:FecR domain-containing protein [Chitinophaga sp. 212800010-3]|uniref:FecR family protein n=1 Tax=unclassified Chitinophaga TaxID=2619133 RepID=UPI002DF13053|nr:FecR domain-containing protein [Chitinophaga sp. 212800010-3]